MLDAMSFALAQVCKACSHAAVCNRRHALTQVLMSQAFVEDQAGVELTAISIQLDTLITRCNGMTIPPFCNGITGTIRLVICLEKLLMHLLFL